MGHNIGFLRLLASLFVLFGHSFNLSAGGHGKFDPLSKLLYTAIPYNHGIAGLGVMVFFILSGYLVTKSYDYRNDLLVFIDARVLRIYPGLIVAVCFCVFFVGPIVTTLPLLEYISHPNTFTYFYKNSSLYEIQFILPAVFKEIPFVGSVNGSLYTLPIELGMYAYVAVVGFLGILKHKHGFNLLFIILILTFIASPEHFPLLNNVHSAYLGLSFLFGAFFYINRDIFRLNIFYALLLLPILFLLKQTEYYNCISLLILSYSILSLGFTTKIRLPSVDRFGDFSYGIYLYAFPLQQLIIFYIGGGKPWIVVTLSLVSSLFMAFLSWHYIEKKCIRSKGKIANSIKYVSGRFSKYLH